MNKQSQAQLKNILAVFFLSMVVFGVYFAIADGGEIEKGKDKQESIVWKTTAQGPIIKNPDGTYTKTLGSATYRDDKSRRFPNFVKFEDTINVTEENGKLKIEDLVENEVYYIELEYEKKNALSSAKSKIEINKSRGYWYFTTDAQTEVNSMSYKISSNKLNEFDKEKEIDIKFEDETLKLGDEVAIDFRQARLEQNITTTYNEETKTLEFAMEKDKFGKTKKGSLSMIDPVLQLQDADTENLKDAHVGKDCPDTNSGSDNSINVGNSSIVGACPSYDTWRAYITFNLSAIDTSNLYSLIQVNLSLMQDARNSGADIDHIVYHVYDDWINGTGSNILTETELTWNNQPCGINFNNDTNCNLTEEDRVIIINSFSDRWYNWNVTNAYNNEIADGFNNISFIIKSEDESTNAETAYYSSKEDTTTSQRPKLTITYTPYIDIISPTPAQTFTDDAPTTHLNISTAVAMDTCYWTNDSGTTNYTMSSINTTYFYNNTAGSLLLDGSHTVEFYCNQSSDGTWRTSDSVTFDVDSVNVTECRDLTVSRTYYLQNDITDTSPKCIYIKNTSVTFEGQGNLINISNAGDYSFLSGRNNTIKNLRLKSSDDYCMRIGEGSYYINITTLKCGLSAFVGGGDEDNIRIYNSTLNGDDYAFLDSGENVSFYDSAFNGGIIDIYQYFSTAEYTAINCTYSSEFVNTNGNLTRKWYFSPQVNYTHNGTAVEGANITAYNVSGSPQFSLLTDSSGQITQQELIEYINIGGTKTYYTNYTINATLSNWDTDSQEINLTTNYVNQQFNISDSTSPVSTITMTSPPDGAGYTNGTWANGSIKATITGYDEVGFDNLAYPKYCNDTTNNCSPSTYIGAGVTITTEGTSYIRYNTTDEQGNIETIKSRTLKIDTIYPTIEIIAPTPYTNTTTTTLNITHNATDTNRDSCWWTNDSGASNTTLASCINITTVTWNEGTSTITIYVNDSAGNENSSSVTFTIDTSAPNISISTPTNETNSTNNTLNVGYSASDSGSGLDSCWWTNNTGTTNTSLTNCQTNITGQTWNEGTTNIIIYVNDTLGNENQTDVTFTIDSIAPSISISTPTNGTNSTNTSLAIGYSASDSGLGLDSCWWTNNSGTTNTTLTNCTTNVTGQTWIEGWNTITVYANDTLGNENSSSTTFRIDTTAPSLSIIHPVNGTTYSTNTTDLNYSVSDAGVGLSTCWFLNDTGANTTIACGTNTSILQATDGTYTVYMWANDTLGNVANASATYTISTTAPAITLINPSNTEILNTSSILFNYTAVDTNGADTCRLWGNWSTGWHNNASNVHGGDTSVNASEGNFTVTIADGTYVWNIWCNDTSANANFSISNYTFSTDTVYPKIDFNTTTSANNTNSTDTFIFINVSITEATPSNITFRLYNQTSEVNSTTYNMATQTSNNTINFTNLPDEFYYYNVTIVDIAGNTNTTGTRIRRLDDTAPQITIDEPKAQNYGDNNTIYLNYTTTDNLIGLDECWYSVTNSTGTVIGATALATCQNTTFSLTGGDEDYTVTLFSRDILLNTNSSSVTFGIRTESPSVVLNIANDTHSNNISDSEFNFTVTTSADNITNCSLYGTFGGAWALNQTINNPSNNTETNFSKITLSEGSYNWSVICYDNFGTSGWALNNHTYVVDTTDPEINITYITTTAGSQTIAFNTSTNDTNTMTCKYSIYNTAFAIDGLNENVAFTCEEEKPATVTAYGTYYLKTYVTDKAGNENSTNQSFATAPISATPPPGGGAVTISGVTALEAFNFTIVSSSFNKNIDISLAKNTVRERKKSFFIINNGIKEIEVDVLCDTQNTNESSLDIDICNYVELSNKSFVVSASEELPSRGYFTILTPENVSIGDKFYFNILAVRTIEGQSRFSKISVSAKVTTLATLTRWAEVPLQGDKPREERSAYPVWLVAGFLSIFLFILTFYIFKEREMITTGFLMAMGLSIGLFILLTIFL